MGARPPTFTAEFARDFRRLLRWRRDVRHFAPNRVSQRLLGRLLRAVDHAPSVGNCQPWRFVLVGTAKRRAAVLASFMAANEAARAGYRGSLRRRYGALKLAGLREAPVQIAVFTDLAATQGRGLGRKTMPETLEFSTVMAIHTLWLAARCYGLGVGWVSILQPDEVAAALDVPAPWKLTAYLCLGYPQSPDHTPELERRGWQARTAPASRVLRR
jgi:5,6-dimethylbenzimidazole synthase